MADTENKTNEVEELNNENLEQVSGGQSFEFKSPQEFLDYLDKHSIPGGLNQSKSKYSKTN